MSDVSSFSSEYPITAAILGKRISSKISMHFNSSHFYAKSPIRRILLSLTVLELCVKCRLGGKVSLTQRRLGPIYTADDPTQMNLTQSKLDRPAEFSCVGSATGGDDDGRKLTKTDHDDLMTDLSPTVAD